MEEKTILKEFFQKYHLDSKEIDFEENCRIFLDEMERGLDGKDSSLAMIPTHIEASGDIPLEKPIIVLDAGGTNLRVATVYFNRQKQPVIKNFKKYPMPGTYGKINKDEFFHALAGCMEHLVDASSRIGFCFSYATEIMSNRDGRLIRFSKEIMAKDVEGELIGESLLKALKSRGFQGEKKIVLLNDTVATLLAGKAASADRFFDGYIGFILGTGMNTCYIEENTNIKKLSRLDSRKSMIINVESGSYGKAPRGKLDLEFDQNMSDPGFYVFEKMISGGYIGKLTLAVLKKAGEEGIFSRDFADSLSKIDHLETRDVNDFLHDPLSLENSLTQCFKYGTERDRVFIYMIIDGLLERAGILTAISLASLMLKTGKGVDPRRPVCISVEGTTFFTLKGLRNKIEYYLKKHMCDDRGVYYEFVSVDQATLIGTAIVGLTN